MSKSKENFELIIQDWNKTSISGYTNSDELKKILEEIYKEIENIDLFENEFVELLIDLPSNLAYEIIYNTRFKSNMNFWNLLIMNYYDKFVRDVNTKNKTGANLFSQRFNNIKTGNAKMFYQERLLSKYELELLFEKVQSKDASIKVPCLALLRNYKGDNKYVLNLIEANKYLNENNSKHHSVMETITKELLLQLLEDLKKLNKCYDC